MLPPTGSTMTQAISEPRESKVFRISAGLLKPTTVVNSASAPGTPGLSGNPSVATPEPAFTSRLSPWPW